MPRAPQPPDDLVSGSARRRRARRLAVLLVACAVLAAAGADAVAIPTARVAPTSSPGVRFGSSRLGRTDFLPISRGPHSAAKVLYSVRLAPSGAAGTVTARGLLQVTYCRATDLAGTNKPAHPCVGTRAYSFDPRVYARLVLAAGPSATGGRVLRDWRAMTCGKVIHHCPLAIEANRVAVPGGGARYVNLVASAQSGEAIAGQVLAIDPTTGGLQVIQSPRRSTPSRTLVSGPRLPGFPVSPGSAQATRASQRPAVIFSQPVTVRAGDIVDVSARFTLTIHDSRDNAPLARAWIVLAPTPTAPYLRPGIPVTARAGQNCPTTCTLTRVAALRSAVSGRRYVNVGVVVKDHTGETSATASYGGVLRVTRR